MTDELTCALCGRPIRSGESTRFIRPPDLSSPRIEHFTCPAVVQDRDRSSPAPPRPANPA